MDCGEFTNEAQLVGRVAVEVIDEPDTISRRPEVVDVVAGLAGRPGLNHLFGGNGHNPDAFVVALASGLRPYTELPLEDPDLVEHIGTLAAALHGNLRINDAELH
jgi:hypothetical protein